MSVQAAFLCALLPAHLPGGTEPCKQILAQSASWSTEVYIEIRMRTSWDRSRFPCWKVKNRQSCPESTVRHSPRGVSAGNRSVHFETGAGRRQFHRRGTLRTLGRRPPTPPPPHVREEGELDHDRDEFGQLGRFVGDDSASSRLGSAPGPHKTPPKRGFLKGGRPDSNRRPPGPQPGALPAELRPPRIVQSTGNQAREGLEPRCRAGDQLFLMLGRLPAKD